jgi:hypothetical protein
MLQIHRDDFLRIGAELFGSDPRRWRFRCPSCGHEQSHEDVKVRNPEIGDTSSWIHFSCEGRRNPGHGCDWTLGGLLRCHKLEVFSPEKGAFVISFEFAHERAPELCEAARFTAPEHPTTEITKWAEYSWPEWIPDTVREGIVDFWCESWNRGPHTWLKDAKSQGAPVLGSRVNLTDFCDKKVEGLYVHCWNNIGRVIRDDGSIACVSF